jgi:hypothetical protein
MRIQKARVAMGELDIVGQGIWDNIALRPRMGRVVSESILVKSSPISRLVPNISMVQIPVITCTDL